MTRFPKSLFHALDNLGLHITLERDISLVDDGLTVVRIKIVQELQDLYLVVL
jgi:hypothetical protein